MFRFIAALLLIFVTSLRSQQPSPEASIVKVIVMQKDTVIGTRSGLVVDRGYVVTTLDTMLKATSVQIKPTGGEAVSAPGVAAYHRHSGLVLLKVDWEGKAPPAAALADGPPAKGTKISMLAAGMGPETLEVKDTADALGFSFGGLRNDSTLDGRALVENDRVVGLAIGPHPRDKAAKDAGPDERSPGPCMDAARVELIRALEPGETIPWSKWAQKCKNIDRSEQIVKRGLIKKDPRTILVDTVKLYQRAVEADPFNWNAWIELTSAYFANHQENDALTAAANAIKLGPTSDLTYRIRALVLAKRGESADATAAARQALKLRPRGEGNHNALGSALMSNHDYAQAVEAFKEELRLHPANAEAKDGLKKAEDWLGQKGSEPK